MPANEYYQQRQNSRSQLTSLNPRSIDSHDTVDDARHNINSLQESSGSNLKAIEQEIQRIQAKYPNANALLEEKEKSSSPHRPLNQISSSKSPYQSKSKEVNFTDARAPQQPVSKPAAQQETQPLAALDTRLADLNKQIDYHKKNQQSYSNQPSFGPPPSPPKKVNDSTKNDQYPLQKPLEQRREGAGTPRGLQEMPRPINPKDLTNEELEYVIKTGKIPPKYSAPHGVVKDTFEVQQTKSPPRGTLKPSLAPVTVTPTPKDTYEQKSTYQASRPARSASSSVERPVAKTIDTREPLHQPLRNRSPQRLHAEAIQPMPTHDGFKNSALRHAPSSYSPNSTKHSPSPPPTFLRTDPYQHTSVGSRSSAEHRSYAPPPQPTKSVSSALKALQDRVETLERERKVLREQHSIVENQAAQELHLRRKEAEQAQEKELAMRDQIRMLQLQLDTAENDKFRHLEHNSQEKFEYETQTNRVVVENEKLKVSLENMVQRYKQIEETIGLVAGREKEKRTNLEDQLQSSQEAYQQLERQLGEQAENHKIFKSSLQSRVNELRDEVTQKQHEYVVNQKVTHAHNQELTRENERLKADIVMMREEIGLRGAADVAPKPSSKSSKAKASRHASVSPKQETNANIPRRSTNNLRNNASVQSMNTAPKIKQIKPIVPKIKTAGLANSKTAQSTVSRPSPLHSRDQNQSLERQHRPTTAKHRHSSPLRPNMNKKLIPSNIKNAIGQMGISDRKDAKKSKKRAAGDSKVISINTKARTASEYQNSRSPQSKHPQPQPLRSPNHLQSFQSLGSKRHSRAPSFEQKLAQFVGQTQTPRGIDDIPPHQDSPQQDGEDSSQKFFKETSGTPVSAAFNQEHEGSDVESFGGNVVAPVEQFKNPEQKRFLENEIFHLEREISDCNTRYKQITRRRENGPRGLASPERHDLGELVQQLMQQLEEKTERLYQLKKERQHVLENENRLVHGSVGTKQPQRQHFV